RRANDVEGGGFRCHHPPAVQPAKRQRAHTVLVTRRVQRVLVHERQAERSPHGGQQLQRGLLKRRVRRRVGEQRTEDVGVGGGGTRAAGVHQPQLPRPFRQLGGVDEVTVVAQRDAGARGGVAEHRLSVFPGRRAGGGVASVTDRDVAFHRGQRLFLENLANQPEILEHQNL